MILPDRENVQKLSKIGQIQILQFFCSFWAFSQPRVIGLISTLLHLVRHLETQVQSTHKAYQQIKNGNKMDPGRFRLGEKIDRLEVYTSLLTSWLLLATCHLLLSTCSQLLAIFSTCQLFFANCQRLFLLASTCYHLLSLLLDSDCFLYFTWYLLLSSLYMFFALCYSPASNFIRREIQK